MLPRAVGYTGGVLDYFFRGKLDVDLVADPADPSRLRLEGTNASPEALVDGTLALYADDANGLRTEATSSSSTAVTNVASGGEITSAWFQPTSTDAERFVAVYSGTLGAEEKDPVRNFPGAIIGKVLGGYRVEHVYADGPTWKLRTPQGIFPLPIATSEVEDLRWGDADNTLVGRSPLEDEPGSYRFFAWEILRPLGSGEVPVEGGVVKLSTPATATFPLGLNLGTTLELVHAIQYQQRLVSFEVTETLVDGSVTSRSVGGGQKETVITDSRTLQASGP